MRRTVPYIAIFALGLWVGYAVLRSYALWSNTPDSRSRQAVLALLEKPAAPSSNGDNPFVRAAARIEPAVVNIDTAGTKQESDYNGRPLNFDFQGKGSGVLISPDGYIVTNNHVIDGASIIRVTTVDNRRFDGRVIGANPDADLAVVKIDATGMPHAELGDSANLKVGEYVIAIGNPLGVGITVTHGIISATDRRNLSVGDGRVITQALQTDAPINRGNSGGALANMDGQLIGINTAIASDHGGGSVGIGFAIPVDVARSVVKDIVENGKLEPEGPDTPFLGIGAVPITPQIASQYNLPVDSGVVVLKVYPLTGADTAGLHRGNIIVALDGHRIASMGEVLRTVHQHKVGDVISLRIVRDDGSHADLRLTLGRKPTAVAR